MGMCGTRLSIEWRVLARMPPLVGEPCSVLRELEKPPSRLYVRVNTARIGVDEYLRLAARAGVTLYRDEEVPHALWAPVEGPFEPSWYPGYVIADKAAAESVLMGSDLYAPGVVEASGFSPGDPVRILGPNGFHVASGIAVMSPAEMIAARRGLAVRVTEPRWRSVRVGSLPGFQEGLIYGQSVPSMYVGLIMEPEPGDLIIDLTAAPGGKVSHIAQIAAERGVRARIIAVDRRSKTARLRATLERLGLAGMVEVVGADSRRLPRLRPELRGRATKVLVDPPCTNLGVRPKVYDSRSSRDVRSLVMYQRGFLRAAWELLAPGGLLVYSTCTLTSDENSSQAAWAMDALGFEPGEMPGFRRPRRGAPWEAYFSPLDGVPGFYIAVLRKPRG